MTIQIKTTFQSLGDLGELYAKTEFTGGTANALDGVDGAVLEGGEHAIVINGGKVYFYILDADSGLAEDVPNVIAPDLNAGDKRWILQGVYAKGVFIDANNYWDSSTGEIYSKGKSIPDRVREIEKPVNLLGAYDFSHGICSLADPVGFEDSDTFQSLIGRLKAV